MDDESGGGGLFDSLDPERRREFLEYCELHQKGLTNCASRILEKSGHFPVWEERAEVARYCVQETFLQLLKAVYRGTKPFAAGSGDPEYVKNWLYQVTKNFAKMAIRRIELRRPQLSLDVLSEIQDGDAAGDDSLVDKAHIDDLVARLPQRQRQIVELYRAEYNSKEIGKMLGMTDGAVRQALVRAIETLRKWHNRE